MLGSSYVDMTSSGRSSSTLSRDPALHKMANAEKTAVVSQIIWMDEQIWASNFQSTSSQPAPRKQQGLFLVASGTPKPHLVLR